MRPLVSKALRYYERFFSIEEVRKSVPLQLVMAASLFVFFISFHAWMPLETVTVENAAVGGHICWPYFQNCGDWFFLSALPYSYSQNLFYMLLFAVMAGVAISLWHKRFALAHAGLVILLIWEVLFIFVLNVAKRGNYDYYQVILTAILLFFPYKFQFLRLTFPFLYFLSSTIKLNEGWVLGTYFTSLHTGLPIFPNETAPLFTNSVIIMEMVGCWFLLSRNRILQRLALTFFIIFHWYSGLIVWYRYPATIMPYLLILFGPIYEREVPLNWKAAPGWAFILFLGCMQSIPFLIPKDSRYTFEGLNYGFYMFDSNHQCASLQRVVLKNGEVKQHLDEKVSSRSRCDPYYKLFKIWHTCRENPERIDRIEWEFIHSINGGPFYRIVNEKNACDLKYEAFRHNEWISTPEDGAELVGYPVKNLYF